MGGPGANCPGGGGGLSGKWQGHNLCKSPLRIQHKAQRILAPLWAWGRDKNCGVLALPPPQPTQSTKNPSPFMGVGQRQELWGSSVTPSAADTKHKES